MSHFVINQDQTSIKVMVQQNVPFSYEFFINNERVNPVHHGNEYRIFKGDLRAGSYMLIIVVRDNRFPGSPVIEQRLYPFQIMNQQPEQEKSRQRDFRPGDILVSSKNINDEKSEYVGHSALIVSPTETIESPGGFPAIERKTVQAFLRNYPIHAHFRPKSPEMGQKAAQFANQYLAQYQSNVANNIMKPAFSFSLGIDLKDLWEYIYCSKLIWLSYYYGANYEMKNDFLWFSPEDLFTNLQKNDDFEVVYIHPEVNFKWNT
ncbi:hypothetical protein [Salirhabdus salicampi]|uniref:hypothetical protein n=1 Tax=Salirhabdus salicampi TaxID=476102 RepID=UPI0020C3B4CD|nr:hypothetical protein [Salirhabdus salicampi]MCP8617304.1 hypothetical protein [Salirhabdus salicampi]